MARVGSFIALLRGLNVGAANRLPMPELAALFSRAGCSDVRTYIQSGNVLFSAPGSRAKTLREELAAAITKETGLRVPVVLRTADELAGTVEKNPFLAEGCETRELHVMFLADVPGAKAAAMLDPKRSPPDEFRLVGRDLYLRLPQGVAESKLTNAYVDKVLATTSTSRNWNTVLKLLALTKAK